MSVLRRLGLVWVWFLAGFFSGGFLIAQPLAKIGERPVFAVTKANAIHFRPGLAAVKFKPSFRVDPFTPITDIASLAQATGLEGVFRKFEVFGASPLFGPVFSNASQQENGQAIARMVDWGFDRWVSLHFRDSGALPGLLEALRQSPGVEIAEPAGHIIQTFTPDDPSYPLQWNLRNTGQTGGTPGADIGMEAAWDIQKGIPEALVSVHDGGIQVDHPDLQQNIWFGKGYNFVSNSPILVPDGHGTHVAGILGAVSNNGMGIAGVAGGNGTAATGIRMMSMQIIGGSSAEVGFEANSFVYAANQGAVVSQNSWSYNTAGFFPSYTADAIDYFIEQGGGTLVKGGVVVFSAGNSNTEEEYYPAPYSRVIAVTASGPMDEKGPYSSYGTWADITAPGGNQQGPGGQAGAIMSTLTGGNYGYLQGTSMAAPHVSGVAALIASHLPGRLVADDIRTILLTTTDDIYPVNQGYLAGKLGSGRLNARKALEQAARLRQQPVLPVPGNVKLSEACDKLEISWASPAATQQVMVAMSTSSFIGMPNGQLYQVGDTLFGGAIVVYKGNGSQFVYDLPVDGTRVYFSVWTVDAAGTNYSTAVRLDYEVPVTVLNPRYTASLTSLTLEWQRQCPNRAVLLAVSTDGVFGTPAGDPANVTDIPGGGTRLAFDTSSSYVHSGLSPDQTYYYAFFPYLFSGGKHVYGEPVNMAGSTACTTVPGAITESFTGDDFPPAGWRVYDGGPQGSLQPDGRTWQRVTLAGSREGDMASALINAYSQNGSGSREILRTPAIYFPQEADSLIVSFDYAYKAYSPSSALADSLELAWTTDCGASLHSVWKKGGEELASTPGFSTAEFIPALQDWRPMKFELSAEVPRGSQVNFVFRATNKFGQNIWLDNVSASARLATAGDAAIALLVSPTVEWQCQSVIEPVIRLVNGGRIVLDSVEVVAMLNGIPSAKATFNLNVLRSGQDTILTLPSLALSPGENHLVVWSQMPNGTADTRPANDTVRSRFVLSGTAADPIREYFDQIDQMPAGWMYTGAPGLPWQVSSQAAKSAPNALLVDNATNPGGSTDLVTPYFPVTPGSDSLLLEFDLAAANSLVSGASVTDTLEILVSMDCGKTMISVARLYGPSLVSVPDPVTGSFVPNSPGQWKHLLVNLTPWLPVWGSTGQVVLRSLSGGAHNLYVDNLQLYSKTIPSQLKREGFGVYPNPFGDFVTLWHLYPPNGLLGALLMDVAGRRVAQWQWKAGTAPQTLRLPTSAYAPGIYTLLLQYETKREVVRLLKMHNP